MLRKYFECNEFVNFVQVTDDLSEIIDEDIAYCFDEPNEQWRFYGGARGGLAPQ